MSVNVSIVRISSEDLEWLRNPGEPDENGEDRTDAWFWSDYPGTLELNKGYASVHFVLTGIDMDGSGPAAFLCDLNYGETIDYEWGYDPGRVLHPAQVAEIVQALNAVPSEVIESRLSGTEIGSVYPFDGSPFNSEDKAWLLGVLTKLKAFLMQAELDGATLLVATL